MSLFEKNIKKYRIFLEIQLTKSKNHGIIIVAVYAKMLCLYSKKIKHNLRERTFGSKMSSDNYASAFVAGFNQSKKCIRSGRAKRVYVAYDAEGRILSEIASLCESFSVMLDMSKTKTELGVLCGIEVDCAVCAFLD